MATEVEYVNYKDFVAGLESTENPGVDDVTVVSNETDGPRAVPANTSALSNTATDSDLTADASIELQTATGKKKAPANLLAKQSGLETTNGDVTALTTYAQNVAKSIKNNFSEEVAYSFGSKAMINGVLRRATENISAGAYDYTKWEAVNEDNKDRYVVSSSNISYLNDLDNYPIGSIVTCSVESLVSSISHLPISEQFVAYTFPSTGSGITVQLYVSSSSHRFFFRRKWSTWSSWIEIGAINTRAFAASIAPEYDSSVSYTAGTAVMKDGVLIRAKEDISAGAYDETKWANKNVFNALSIDVTSSNVAVYSDLNDYPLNSICSTLNNSVAASISHKPVESQFMIYTIGQTGVPNCAIQFFLSQSSKRLFFRGNWGGWSEWQEIIGGSAKSSSISSGFSNSSSYKYGDLVMVGGQLKRALKNLNAGAFNLADWQDKNVFNANFFQLNSTNIDYLNGANVVPKDSVIVCMTDSLAASFTDIPENVQFALFTFGPPDATAISLQFFVPYNSSKLYYRRRWNTWTQWQVLEVEGAFFEPQTVNPLACYDNFVCIGDSLTWCQVYTGSGISDQRQAKKLWGDILAYNCNATAQTIASPGDTAARSWPRVDAALTAKINALAIVYLGTNAGLTDTLDTDAPEGVPYTSWADTNTGCYAKIVAKAQSLGYKVMLLKNSDGTTGTVQTTQEVIGKIGARFGCCVVEPFRTTELKYHYYPDLSGYNSLHYNDLGYAWFASALLYHVSKAGNDQLKYIIPA